MSHWSKNGNGTVTQMVQDHNFFCSFEQHHEVLFKNPTIFLKGNAQPDLLALPDHLPLKIYF
jgi:uncharacterized membrane protein